MRRRDRQFHVNEVRRGRDTYRVIHPARPIAHGAMYEAGWGVEMYVNKAATVDFALAWWLAARSPHSLVYLPLRSSACDPEVRYLGRRLDLVFLHHTLKFPTAQWKDVRARLTPTGLQKVELPATPFRTVERAEHERSWRRGFKDHLRYDFAADTLFVVGSRQGYELGSKTFVDLVEQGPAELATAPDAHVCGELDLGVCSGSGPIWKRRDAPLRLHVVACNDHW
ncbi:hypothetical protein [Kutzneria chonburiensis]|uniref:Uncharacterized protein n=1 Tax=Kutzneria chonburiensis TaxID=1483604 RepID=A0ABV6N824_9PSEU